MATWKERIEQYVHWKDDASLLVLLKSAIEKVIKDIIEYKEEDIPLIAASLSGGFGEDDLTSWLKVIDVRRLQADTESSIFREAKEVSYTDFLKASDENSLSAANIDYPVYTISDGGIDILPSIPTSPTLDMLKVYGIKKPDSYLPSATTTEGHASSTVLHPKYESALYIYMAQLLCLMHMTEANSGVLSTSLTNLPTLDSIAVVEADWESFTSSDIITNVLADIIDIGFLADGDFDLPDAAASIGTFISSVTEWPTIEAPSISVPDWVEPATLAIPILSLPPTLESLSVTFSETAPTYTAPSLTLSSISVTPLSISASAPSAAAMSTAYIYFDEPAPTYIAPTIDIDFTTPINTWITDEEDPEMSQATVQVIQTQIQKYNSDIQSSLNAFNEANATYQVAFQKATQDAQLDSQESAQAIQAASANIQRYQAEVTAEVQEYQQNLASTVQVWQTKRTTELQEHTNLMTNALNTFNKENIEYQSKLQVAIQNSQLDNQEEALKLQKYGAEVQAYQAEVASTIQAWTASTWNVKFLVYQQDYNAAVQVYAQDIQNVTAEIASSVQKYQVETTSLIQKFQADASYDTTRYTAQIQRATAKVTHELNNEVQAWQQRLQAYQAQGAQALQNNQLLLQRYQADSQSFTAAYQAFGLLFQEKQTHYNWAIQQYTALKAMYSEIFGLTQPQQQQVAIENKAAA
jgi:hypothetical protein